MTHVLFFSAAVEDAQLQLAEKTSEVEKLKGELSTFTAKSEMLEDFRTELTASREQNEKNLKLITELRDENNQKTSLLDQSAIFFKKKEDAIAELSEKVKNLEHEKQQIESEMNEKVSALSNFCTWLL